MLCLNKPPGSLPLKYRMYKLHVVNTELGKTRLLPGLSVPHGLIYLGTSICPHRKPFTYTKCWRYSEKVYFVFFSLNRTHEPRTCMIYSKNVNALSSLRPTSNLAWVSLSWSKFSYSPTILFQVPLPWRCVLILLLILRCNIVQH